MTYKSDQLITQRIVLHIKNDQLIYQPYAQISAAVYTTHKEPELFFQLSVFCVNAKRLKEGKTSLKMKPSAHFFCVSRPTCVLSSV